MNSKRILVWNSVAEFREHLEQMDKFKENHLKYDDAEDDEPPINILSYPRVVLLDSPTEPEVQSGPLYKLYDLLVFFRVDPDDLP